jgi:hypothetical protein
MEGSVEPVEGVNVTAERNLLLLPQTEIHSPSPYPSLHTDWTDSY